jgi:hypothetical protein
MFQRKLIVVLSVAVLLAMTAGVSQASWSRVEGMGLTVPAMSQFTDDYANMFAYPTSVVRQNNIVWAELGNNPGGGVNGVDTEDQAFTLVRNFPRLGSIAFQMKQSALNSTVASDNLNNEQLDIIWGKAFSSFDFAVRLDITNSSEEFTDSTPFGYEAHGIDFSGDPYPFGAAFFEDAIVGTGVEINTYGITPAIAIHMDNDDRFEAAATYRRYTLDRSDSPAPGETWQDGGNASYALNARAILHRGGTHTWYPAAWYVNDDLSWEVTGVTPTARSADESYKQFGIGISDNMRVNSDNLLLWGVMFAQDKHSYERTDNNDAVASGATKTFEEKHTMMPLVFAAIETQATSWLTVRIGASRGMLSSRDEFTDFGAPAFTFTDKTRESEFNFSLGTGIKWNNLDVDMTLNEEFPLSGGYILSGNEATPFTRVSATYHF